MNKRLTGEIVYNALIASQSDDEEFQSWPSIQQSGQDQEFEQVAKYIMEELGICSDCGARPETGLLEVAGEYWCSDCCNPPQDDPKIQYMHMVFNPDNTLAGVITPPAGMSLEEYRKQLTEEMSHISFELDYNFSIYVAKTYKELYEHWDAIIPTPEPGQSHEYFIHVMYDGTKEIGKGWYKCASYDAFEVVNESGAAEGLMDALYEYASSQV